MLVISTEIRYKLPYLPKLIDDHVHDLYERTANCKIIGQVDFQVDLKRLVMKQTMPENFNSDATMDRFDATSKAHVDSSQQTRPDSQV